MSIDSISLSSIVWAVFKIPASLSPLLFKTRFSSFQMCPISPWLDSGCGFPPKRLHEWGVAYLETCSFHLPPNGDLNSGQLARCSEKAVAPHSSTLAWKIPWTEEPGRLQSMGSLRVRHDWATSCSLFTFMIGEGNGNPLHCSCLENPRDRGAWWSAICVVAHSGIWLKWLSSSSRQAVAGFFPHCVMTVVSFEADKLPVGRQIQIT